MQIFLLKNAGRKQTKELENQIRNSVKFNTEVLSGLLVTFLLKRCFKMKEAQEA